MQQGTRASSNRPRFSGFSESRVIMILLAVAIAIVAAFVFRATRGTSPTVSAARVVRQIAPGTVPAAAHRTAARRKTRRPAVHHRTAVMDPDRKVYAARIVPVIDRSTRIFERAARSISQTNGQYDRMTSVCSMWSGRVEAIESSYEGVPHPYGWWTPAGSLHHQISGTYHYMLGAIQNCQEAAQASDSGASSAAISQITAAARGLRSQENYARFLATH